MPFRVLRCQIAQLGKDGPLYSGGCQFKRPIDLVAHRELRGQARLDLTLRELLLSEREKGTGHARGSAVALPTMLRSLQTSPVPDDPLSRGIRDVLSELVPALDRGEATTVLRVRLQGHLRAILPDLAITVSSAPLKGTAGTESIYFATSHTPASAVLNVELPADAALPEWQFRMLQAGGYLLDLISMAGPGLKTEQAKRLSQLVAEIDARSENHLAPPPTADPETRPGWQKIVVRYRNGQLLKGFTHDFHPTRPQFSLWPTIDAAPNERVHVPMSLLKAVFFVRDFDGDPAHSDPRTFVNSREGRRLEVTFADGEVLLGTTLSYRPDGIGFFINPADQRGNNQRVFAVSQAIRHVRFV